METSRTMRTVLRCGVFLLIGNTAVASTADLSNANAVSGLKQALNDGSLAVVAKLGVENGFFGNPKVKIPLPPTLKKIEDAQLGLIKKDQATIEGYVTQKALDGLYFMIAEQEKAFRQNPVGATSDIVKKVFGAVR